jgi:hypothetical protein
MLIVTDSLMELLLSTVLTLLMDLLLIMRLMMVMLLIVVETETMDQLQVDPIL